MLLAAVIALAVTVWLLLGCVLVSAWIIRNLDRTVRTQEHTEQRLTANVRLLQDELLHHAAEAQVITLWRDGHQMTTGAWE